LAPQVLETLLVSHIPLQFLRSQNVILEINFRPPWLVSSPAAARKNTSNYDENIIETLITGFNFISVLRNR